MLGQRLVHVPPALLLFAVVAAGAVFGVDGVVLAAPLAAVAFVLVRELYVRGTLDKRIQVPGEDRR